MGARPLALTLVAALLGGTLACEPPPRESWRDQLVPDSPCYRVNLLDGLDESSTEELRDLFDCLNRQGHLEPLAHAVDQLEQPSRDAVPAGVEVARAANALPKAGVNPFALAGVAVDALRAEDRPVDEVMDILLELIYGRPASDLRNGVVMPYSTVALEEGLLVPLAPVLPVAAGALLDDELQAAEILGEALSDPELVRLVRTLEAYATSDDPTVREAVRRLLPSLGQAIGAARSPENNFYGPGSGDSLRDLVEVMVLGPEPLLDDLQAPVFATLGDVKVRTVLPHRMLSWQADGHLQQVGPQAAWLASVDAKGDPLSPGKVSGLHSLVRLLHDTNRPMVCSLDLWVTELEVDLGNLAVAILRTLADMNPDTVQTGAGIFGTVIGWSFSQTVLAEIADTGVCPTFTPQVVHDLQAMDLFQDEKARDVLVVFISLLNLLKDGHVDRLPDFADLVTALHAGGGTIPLEELLRDLGHGPLIQDVVALVPALVEPEVHGITAGDESAFTLHDAMTHGIWLVEPRDGLTGWERLAPVLRPVLARDEVWEVSGRAGALLRDPDSATAGLVDLLPRLTAFDPDLVLLQQVGPLLVDPKVAGPLLRAAETEGVAEALLASQVVHGQPEVPLAFGSRLVLDGTLDNLLALMDLVFRALDGVVDLD